MVAIGNEPPATAPRRGDVHVVQFEDLGGHVLRGQHPAVVVSADRLNRPGGTVLVCSMTSGALRRTDYIPPYLVRVVRQETGLDRDGWVKCDQIFTRPDSWLGLRVGRLSPEAMARVNASLRFVLAI